MAYKTDWTPKEIEERGLLMLEFMEKRWNFKFEDWDINKKEVLFPTRK